MKKMKTVSIIFFVIGIILSISTLILAVLMFTNPVFMLFFIALLIYFLIVYFVYLILAIVDILKSNKPGNWKRMWIAIVLIFSLPGIIIYFLVGAKQKGETKLEEPESNKR